MRPKSIPLLIALIITLVLSFPVAAQEETDQPVYIVQSGDSLTTIALRFGISLNDLLNANDIQDPNSLNIGDRLVIPGLEGIRGTLVMKTFPLGENLKSYSLAYQLPESTLTRLNRITSPAEIYAGISLIVPEQSDTPELQPVVFLVPGQSLLEAAVLSGSNPWTLAFTNRAQGSWEAVPGEYLYAAAGEDKLEFGLISPLVNTLEVDPLPLVQGKTTVIKVETTEPAALSGNLARQSLHFFEHGPNQYVALVGIPALQETGLSEIRIQGTSQSGAPIDFQQTIFLSPGLFTAEVVSGVQANTIDPEVIRREDETLAGLQSVTTTRYWDNTFRYPVDEPCPGSRFGNRRSYNGDSYFYFHTGLDFTVCAQNLNIYAAAPGNVIFSGPLEIKGNFTVIDHGWGVYSAYAHQSEMFVSPGDQVEAGQMIGIIGNTGRSVGPHLHWEVWINGVQVDPLDWVSRSYP